VLFAGPVKPSVLAKWAEVAPPQTLDLVAPFPLTHRQPPSGAKLWEHDSTSGDFRIGDPGRAALDALAAAVLTTRARGVVFRSPENFSPSSANRDALKRFFAELPALGERVWVPGGLWDVRTAVKLATELGVTCGFDPLIRELGQPPEIHHDLEAASLHFRIVGAGRSGTIRNEHLEDLAALIEHYEDLPVTVAFASPERWQDARNLLKLIDAGNE
jgi:uncharacterized protein YecE (DUF72 family)